MNVQKCLCVAAAAVCAAAGTAHAGPIYNFSRVTSNALQNVASQMTMEVNPATSGLYAGSNNLVSFKFFNTGSVSSAVSEIYFEDGTLLAPFSLVQNQMQTAFVQGNPNPGAPPGVNPFTTSRLFSADASGNPSNGLNPGEFVEFIIELQSGKTFADTITALNNGLDGRDPDPNSPGHFTSLRVAMHTRSIGSNNQSDSFLLSVVPLPPAAWAGLSTLAGVGFVGYIRRRKNAAQ